MSNELPDLPMLRNIRAQANSLEDVLRHSAGDGAAALGACAALLRSAAGRVFVSGMGASFFAALPATAALQRQGRPAQLLESSELLHHGSWLKDDVALLISRSGESVEVLRVAERMRADGVRIVGVTNVPGSPLEQMSDAAMVMGARGDQIVAVQTYTGTLLALQILVEQVASPAGVPAMAAWQDALAPLPDFVDVTINESADWESFLAADGPLYVLGRGDAVASAYEGALLFHETAKLPTIGMSSGQFRHGPVETVGRATRVIVIGSPEKTRSLDWRLALDLRAMGASVRWIGPVPAGRAEKTSCLGSWPAPVAAAVQPIFDIVPLQVAAYRAALLHGVTPGDFRYASAVTSDEIGFPLFSSTSDPS